MNVYISDKEKVRDLYRCFFHALKKGGSLIIGVLTYPPSYEKVSDWNLAEVSEKDMWMEKVLFQNGETFEQRVKFLRNLKK